MIIKYPILYYNIKIRLKILQIHTFAVRTSKIAHITVANGGKHHQTNHNGGDGGHQMVRSLSSGPSESHGGKPFSDHLVSDSHSGKPFGGQMGAESHGSGKPFVGQLAAPGSVVTRNMTANRTLVSDKLYPR